MRLKGYCYWDWHIAFVLRFALASGSRCPLLCQCAASCPNANLTEVIESVMSMLQEFDVEMMSLATLKERRADLIRTKEIARKVC